MDLTQSPSVRKNFVGSISYTIGMTLNGDFLYIASESIVYKRNLNSPNPSVVGVINGLQNARMVAFDGVNIYFAQVGQGKISQLKIGTSAVIDISQTNIEVFPNPTEGDIQLRNVSAEMVEVFDNMGHLVLSEMNPGSNVDISQNAAGVYFLHIYADGQVYATKVVKQ